MEDEKQSYDDEISRFQVREIASASGPWLNAWHDPMAHLKATSSRVATVDVTNDGNHALLVVDDNKRLKVFRGMNLISSHKLLDTASCLSVFHPSSVKTVVNASSDGEQQLTATSAMSSAPSLPAVAVATGSYIYIYRCMRPYYKFTLPPVALNADELYIWDELRVQRLDNEQALTALVDLNAQNSGQQLTFRSMFILSVVDRTEQLKYVDSYKTAQLQQSTCVTCMASINLHDMEQDSISALVVGTEANDVLFLHNSGTHVLQTIALPSTPWQMSVIGAFNIDYRVIIATRSAVIYTIRNGKLLGHHIQMESAITCMTAFHKNVIVACINKTLYAYHIKGNNVKLWSLYFKAIITSIEPMTGPQFAGNEHNYFLCGFENGDVAMYNNNQQIHLFKTSDSCITAMKFGKYGRENASLILLNQSGCLSVKILSRRIDIKTIKNEHQFQQNNATLLQQQIPLNLPPISQLYLDQEIREKENAESMHKIWQKEIVKFRVHINNEYINVLKKGHGPVANHYNGVNPNNLLLNVQIIGLGPWFTLQITLKNIGKSFVSCLRLIAWYDDAFYAVPSPIINIPFLVPALQYKYNMKLQCIEPNGNSKAVQLAIMDENHKHFPFMTAIVDMPIADVTD